MCSVETLLCLSYAAQLRQLSLSWDLRSPPTADIMDFQREAKVETAVLALWPNWDPFSAAAARMDLRCHALAGPFESAACVLS